jgi:hypothetical protein
MFGQAEGIHWLYNSREKNWILIYDYFGTMLTTSPRGYHIFGFQIFRFVAYRYLIKVIPETRRAH